MAHLSLLCLGFVLLASVWSTPLNVDGSSKRVLVLLDNLAIRESHSFYFQQLKGEHGFSSVVRVNIRCSILSIGNQVMNSINIAVHILNIFDWNDLSVWRLSLVKIRFDSIRLFVLHSSESHLSRFHLDRGFDITYRASDDTNLQIVKYGEYIYDHILLFAPATKGTTDAVGWTSEMNWRIFSRRIRWTIGCWDLSSVCWCWW